MRGAEGQGGTGAVDESGRAAVVEPPVRLGEVVIIGGGCYGTFYAKQLRQARAKGKAEYDHLLVIDRDPECRATRALDRTENWKLIVQDWSSFFDGYLRPSASLSLHPSHIVPSPLMPHLMYEWLVRRARARWPTRLIETRPLSLGPETPYDTVAPDHTRYVSFADWLCPAHCTEPALCPVIRAPRTWEMFDALERLTRRLDRTSPTAGPVLFVCRHLAFGVGTFSVADVLNGERAVAEAAARGSATDVVVGTISACHGAVNLLHLGQA